MWVYTQLEFCRRKWGLNRGVGTAPPLQHRLRCTVTPHINSVATKRLRLTMEMDEERKSRLEKMVATVQLQLALIKDVVNVGVVSSLKPILKSWQLCLSFKLDVLTT